jgi:ribulose-5-phosphate 4-epimerase/fuculose-1-phosphate aldolase
MFRTTENKLIHSGLVDPNAPLMGCLDAHLEWNRTDGKIPALESIFNQLNINALIFSQPCEPYRSIIDYLAETSNGTITPNDCETRTFLHDLPVAFELSPDAVVPHLKARKCVIIPGHGIITYGMAGLEQAYVTFSSVCFAGFVKFFVDFLFLTKRKHVDNKLRQVFDRVIHKLDPPVSFNGSLMKGPFKSKKHICEAIQEAGRLTVEHRLVDSYFGNISFCHDQTLYISQTGSSLDRLKDAIDPCPLDGSSCVPITASSELPTHLKIVQHAGGKAILHGHPKFSVILSMDCDVENCACREKCHLKCPHERFVCGIPIVSGEVGSGPYALCNTVPQAIQKHSGVIVYGHGVFTTGKTDFNRPFKNLIQIENNCRAEYFKRILLFETDGSRQRG